ncbi:cyclin-like protein [Gloeophyllum trabeum ATCC 11539]|uniref:Cyclin-like protein n=1 Tax=Gloeophyllum trabeum (strain ATCC 11539 / FP-39264 / Madison 617) TaxID=670483 RepID=S7RJG1_GLOTA|nr:cyclin-like protein [Gloeophyllum trabeum ATCC 11539]EPQ54470.1 cyclin-like protein [Gloeophyllum trabeum ATCC 11539]
MADTSTPASQSKHHHPYFTPSEVDRLSEKQRGKLSVTQEERSRQQACSFIEAIGAKIGFPRKTIATAQNLYHRFHLFFPRKDFSYHDVSLAALYVSTKMHDTLKKPRELLMVSYAVRFPELAAKSRSLGGEVDMDPNTVENDRQRLLAVERLILEMICFNFTSRLPFPYVIKIGRALRATKKLTKLAWRLAVDSHRTPVTLSYPAHEIALGCLYLAALLSSFEQGMSSPAFRAADVDTSNGKVESNTPQQIVDILGNHGDWEHRFQARVEDIEEIAHQTIDLLLSHAQNPLPSTPSPSSPSPHLPTPSSRHTQQQPLPPAPYKHDQLMRLKIHMRETEHPPRPRPRGAGAEGEVALLGRNEGTVRFLFGPGGGR